MVVRSLQANKYYWKVVIPQSRNALIDAGWEREIVATNLQVHEFWKGVLNIESTSSLNSLEFTNFIEDIKRICAVYLHYYIND